MSGGTPPDISGKADTVLTTNGDTLYYNNGRQRLAKGTDSQVLTLSSGLPSWATASAGQMELIANGSAVTSSSTVTLYDSTSLTDSDYSKLILIIRGGQDVSFTNPMKINFNNSSTQYHWIGTRQEGGGSRTDFSAITQSSLQCANATSIMNATEGFYVIVEMLLNFADENYLLGTCYVRRWGDNRYEMKHFSHGGNYTGLSKIVLTNTSGNTINGTKFELYGLKAT